MYIEGKVSVIMAVYNTADTVKTAIDSILNQTYEKWQMIICDDASTDDTYKIVKDYEKKYPEKFIVIKNDVNSKLAFSLNHCLKYADGEFVARMDADDISLPERFSRQVEFLSEHKDIDVVGTAMTRFDENGDYGTLYPVENPNKYVLKSNVPHFHATIMMRKKAMDSISGYTVSKRTVRGQDVDLWFRFYAKGYKGANLSQALYKVFEGRNAIKRRKLKYSINVVQTNLMGYKLLKFPFWWYIYAFKPVISFFIPYKLKVLRRNLKLKKQGKNNVDKK